MTFFSAPAESRAQSQPIGTTLPPIQARQSSDDAAFGNAIVLRDLSDAELQQYILSCAVQFVAAQRRWETTGCFAAIGDRDRWWQAEADALVEQGCRFNA